MATSPSASNGRRVLIGGQARRGVEGRVRGHAGRLHVAPARSYVNNLTAEDGRTAHNIWGANFERLVTIKRRYDPDNVFRLNHNIDPRT